MEIILDIIFEIFGELIESTDDLYDVNKKGRKWKFAIHFLSILKIAFGGFGAGFLFMLGFANEIEGTEHTVILRLFLVAIGILFLVFTIKSVRKYSEWREKIRDTVEERKAELKSDNVYDLYDDEANKEWLKNYYGEDYDTK